MPKQRIAITQDFPASRDAVFAHLTDHNKVGPILGAKMERIKDGDDAPNGVHSVRKVSIGPLSFEETVVRHEPPARMEYTVTSKAPIKNHRGIMLFEDTSDGCRLHYEILFDGRLPFTGGLIRKQLEAAIRKGLSRYARSLA
ncbi:SRPBCC family protein [Abyssibacter profundi]|uniref:SRPBCC family protein n=1 Tax=Abyssibacter profundi TaxID=2182787 RepID=A0A363UL73_9GAMM|nr:SRPBCC family protein [Abyssibacter profundi]MBV61909.1 MxaD family protein [Nevskiales bacterium]PWN56170.1 SRPBCC family protein [Abyssibacter profundi]